MIKMSEEKEIKYPLLKVNINGSYEIYLTENQKTTFTNPQELRDFLRKGFYTLIDTKY